MHSLVEDAKQLGPSTSRLGDANLDSTTGEVIIDLIRQLPYEHEDRLYSSHKPPAPAAADHEVTIRDGHIDAVERDRNKETTST